MKTAIIKCILTLLVIIGTLKGYGQQTDSLRKRSLRQMSEYLRTDTTTARRISEIQESYKKALRVVLSDGSLNEEQKHTAMERLIETKNAKLERLVSPSESYKVIPSTERKSRRMKQDSSARQ